MTDLKPCPFCGGEAKVSKWERGFKVLCQKVFCAVLGPFNSEAEAIEAWNTRAERTCHVVKASRKYVLSDGTELFEDGCSICNEYIGEDDNYCFNCGAKVVKQ